MAELPRLKPDPIPAIHPVPEFEAAGRLAKVYAKTKAGLGVPWMGVVAMAFAHYPSFYQRLWTGLEPTVRGVAFRGACDRLRQTAKAEAGALAAPSILPRLRALGYGEAEIEEIRACNEVFSEGNMPYLLLAAVARRLLEGCDWPGGGEVGGAAQANGAPKPPLMEAHHADPATAAVYADIRETLGLPFVNTDYRAFARWPSYFAPTWADLKSVVQSDGYEARVARVHEKAVELAAALPNPTGLGAAELCAAAEQDAALDEVLSVVRLFQWLLPGLAVNVAFLRAQLYD